MKHHPFLVSTPILVDSLRKLEENILMDGLQGYDPYDALVSPIFQSGFLKKSKLARFGVQQLFKRMPVNVRPLLAIQKGKNPVTFGLCLQAFTYLQSTLGEGEGRYQRQIEFCFKELALLQSKGYSGTCWGYDFDWEARYASIPAFTPTIVATGFVTNALFENYRLTGNEESFEFCRSAVSFVLNDLRRTYDGGTFCYSYSPLDQQVVYNATMKGARLLAQVYSITKEERLVEEARKTIRFVMSHQQSNGSWSYSFGDSRSWIDNFHTGYVLDCLDEYMKRTQDREYEQNLKRGVDFYVKHFFTDGGIPKYYADRIYPIDSTAAAQSILTLTRFGEVELATRVALWMMQNMQDQSGFFYYQKHRTYTNRISYLRWSNAWMLLALSYLLYNQNAMV